MGSYRSNENPMFRNKFAEDIFKHKYAHEGADTWEALSRRLVDRVMGPFRPKAEVDRMFEYMRDLKFIPGGRYLYYANRKRAFFNNCFLLRAEEDTREDWAELSWKAERCLMIGGGIGIDYSRYRGAGSPLSSTGGVASGPIPKMLMINEIGRHVMQGGSRRSALYASLNREHPDVRKFLKVKDWHSVPVGSTGYSLADIKAQDFNFAAPLDMTNVSINYGDDWLDLIDREDDPIFYANVRQAMETGEPGFSFNFGADRHYTLRNACTEVVSRDDSDVCNLGSVNMANCAHSAEFEDVVALGTVFLLCGTMVSEMPYEKADEVRKRNRRIGLGLMGVHEWLLQRDYRYEVTPELHDWLSRYRSVSTSTSYFTSKAMGINTPIGIRAIAPTGSIGILAGTTTGIEPIFAVAYKRRYLKGKDNWVHQYVIDGAAQSIIERTGIDPNRIESSLDLASDIERRVKFQFDVQQYVDMGISSTVNLPAWGTEHNNENTVAGVSKIISKYAHGLRGLTFYPDGARGGQPLTGVSYAEAKERGEGEYVEESHDVCSITGKGGVCGA